MISAMGMVVLGEMRDAEARGDHEDGEILCSGLDCWIGLRRVSRRTVANLRNHYAVTLRSQPGDAQRFGISGVGRAILEDPAVADRVLECLLRGVQFDNRGYPIAVPQTP